MSAEALLSIGKALVQTGRFAEAEPVFRRLCAAHPNHPAFLTNLALALAEQGGWSRAETLFRRLATRWPDRAAGHLHLGRALMAGGRIGEAAASARRAAALEPASPRALASLADILAQGTDGPRPYPQLLQLCRRSLRVDPMAAREWRRLAAVRQHTLDHDVAVECVRRSIALAPDDPVGYGDAASLSRPFGTPAETAVLYRRSLTLDPTSAERHRSLLAAVLYDPEMSARARFAEHRLFAIRHAGVAPAPPAAPHGDGGNRRLRIGYLSSDFRDHSVARNMEPILRHRDRDAFHVVCYASVRVPDRTTETFRELADEWRDVVGLDDAAVAAAVRADRIDILVVLAGHFDENRPLVATYRPAPIQVSFHDPATSGLTEFDYLIADRFLVPGGTSERFTERVVRLPRFFVHPPLDDAPAVTPLPLSHGRGPVFASFNNTAKLTVPVLELWARLLASIPASTLVLRYGSSFASAALRKRVTDVFAAHGVDAGRIGMPARVLSMHEHLAMYGHVDVALDPFPFCGATTSFEALWMGVPVVAWPQDTMVSRWSAAMLQAIGLDDLVADTADAYIAIARRLTADVPRLASLRAELRARVAASPLCDGRRRTRQLERAYRAMWRRHATASAAGR
ncbi:MAG TPA: tetratricopeptide repeat protein [Azospirillum sp.]|nr:tetratricopeptide repeat protein [Azospirillum sp.]